MKLVHPPFFRFGTIELMEARFSPPLCAAALMVMNLKDLHVEKSITAWFLLVKVKGQARRASLNQASGGHMPMQKQ